MAKIGTAHIELKPVLNEGALEGIIQRIADAVAQGVERGIAASGDVLAPYPGIITNEDRSVINWDGVNYVPQSTPDVD